MALVAKVAVSAAPYSIDRPYDYLVPEELEPTLRPGMRCAVPFGRGNQMRDAIVLQVTRAEELSAKLKRILAQLDDVPMLSQEDLQLALWMREQYFCTVYDAARAMLPAGLWFSLRDGWKLAPGWTGRPPTPQPAAQSTPGTWWSCCWPTGAARSWARSGWPSARPAPTRRCSSCSARVS